jgi:DNA-binding beta-propeller fold protein YncE
VAGLVGLVILGLSGTAVAITQRVMTATPGLSPPGCVTTSARAPRLAAIHPRFVSLAGLPFAVAVTGDGRWAFVSTGVGHAIEVLRSGPGAGAVPVPVRQIRVPGIVHGEVLTPDGRYLVGALGSGAVVVDVARAEQGRPGSVVGTLTSPGGANAIEVALASSSRGQFAFVTLQQSGTLAVFNLGGALTSGFRDSGFVGSVPLGVNPIGIAAAPDGQSLYVTTQKRSSRAEQGGLTVISVPRAESHPATAIMTTVSAGCEPGRVITTPGGSGGPTVWVTARASNALLAFSAARLRTDPAAALIAKVQVGQSPIGMAAVPGGGRILVANSAIHAAAGAASLGVIDTAAALGRRPALLGVIGTGTLPRELAVEPDGRTALVTNSGSHQLEAVNISHLG